jgi:hypothetical protein
MTVRFKCHLPTATAVILAGAGVARADETFTATLTHTQEVSTPPIPNEGSSGTAVFILNSAGTRLTYDVQLSGLDLGGQTADPNDDVTRAHFHAAPAGSNGGIVYGIIDQSPTLQNDNNPNDLSVNAATGRITGAWDAAEGNGTTLTAQLNALRSGGLYFNIHTFDHGGGEIRGQVLPEPTAAMLLLGGAAVPLLRARRRRA